MAEKTPSNTPLPPQKGTQQKGAPIAGESTKPSGAPSGKGGSDQKKK
jgi:hypothetical protein